MKRRHQVITADGSISEGDYECEPDLERVGLPASLAGETLLDIGCSDGGHSFAAEARGAIVTGIDSQESPRNEGRNFFELTRDELGYSATYEGVSLAEFVARGPQSFEHVLYFNVLYHVEDVIGASRDLFAVTRPGGRVYVKTLVDSLIPERLQRLLPTRWGVMMPPAFRFEEGGLDGDATCYFTPNPPAVLALLRSAGFVDVMVKARDVNRLYVQATRPGDH
ncbi:MAG: class I SAM-dependent methyltransferase [Acidimicrobiales bacterium]